MRHSADWMVRLGDGTAESHERVQAAVDELWRYTGELFIADDVDRAAAASGLGVDPVALEGAWRGHVDDVMTRGTLQVARGEVHAARRPAGQAHRASRPHARGDADRRAQHPDGQW